MHALRNFYFCLPVGEPCCCVLSQSLFFLSSEQCTYKIYGETGNSYIIVRNMTESFEFNENDVQEVFLDVMLEIKAFGNFL